MTAVVEYQPVDVHVTETSWRPQGPMSFEQWQDAGQQLQRIARSVNWLLGDWIAYGEHSFGETYTQAIEQTGLETQTLMNIASVSRRVEASRRRETLSWSHHEAVAALEPPEQERWLAEAETEGYTVKRLRARVAGVERDAPDPEQQLAPTHVAQVRFKFVAESDTTADARVRELVGLLERRGVRVCHQKVDAL